MRAYIRRYAPHSLLTKMVWHAWQIRHQWLVLDTPDTHLLFEWDIPKQIGIMKFDQDGNINSPIIKPISCQLHFAPQHPRISSWSWSLRALLRHPSQLFGEVRQNVGEQVTNGPCTARRQDAPMKENPHASEARIYINPWKVTG